MAEPERTFVSALESRNASREMRELWSPHRKFATWRRIWLALAESQRDMGVAIPEQAISQMRRALDSIDADAARAHEERLRHDVMAHVHAFGDAAPAAKGVIHLAATSQDVVCNADALVLAESLDMISVKLARLVDRAARAAERWKSVPALGFTHFQPAQPVTVGKRCALWAQDALESLLGIEQRRAELRLRGLRGATGTQASYLSLLGGDPARVDELEDRFVRRLGWNPDRCWTICGQTYPRLEDARIVAALAVAASSIHKIANDIRLLAGLKEVEEPFEEEQIGSSAMPYKRNPMRCERASGLARFVMSLAHSALDTAATQWLERTLDDSSNRRLVLPEAFLALDGAVDVMVNVLGGLVVNERVIDSRLRAELPFLATEEILLASVRSGLDRQVAHEALRRHSHAAGARVKQQGEANDLLERLAADPLFSAVDLSAALEPSRFVGRAAEQVDRFIAEDVAPMRERYGEKLDAEPELRV
ncbi:MAG: adenylosuccinate lyase [Phycisphaerae bacterium]|nr:adenylosuccinate lyase [Phycisphaerae bacterium]